MLIGQAIYGDYQGGHALLCKSAEDGATFSDLLWRTDLPSTTPSGIRWEPYISGFPYRGNYYVLMKTFPDLRASRGGMVLSHALLLPLEEASLLDNLSAVANLLFREPVRLDSISSVHLDSRSMIIDPRDEHWKIPDGLPALMDALLGENASPVVWLGQQGFDEAIFILWRYLWPEMRRTFSFRLSFGPQDTRDAPPTVVCSPAALESRWTGYSVVYPSRGQAAHTSAAKFLLHLPGGESLHAFAEQIHAHLISLSDLRLLVLLRDRFWGIACK